MSNGYEAARQFLIGPERPFEEGLLGRRCTTLWEFHSFDDWYAMDVVRAVDAVVYRKAIWSRVRDARRYSMLGYTGSRVPALSLWRSPWLRLPSTADDCFCELEELKDRLPVVDDEQVTLDGVGYGIQWGNVGAPVDYHAELHGSGWKETIDIPSYLVESRPDRARELRQFAVCGQLWVLLSKHFDEWAA